MKKKVLIVFGTRPEAIKMAPLAYLLLGRPEFETKICVTAQHREMLDQVLKLFDLKPDIDLNIMKASQDLYELSSNILLRMKEVLLEYKPLIVLVHGDTTTAFITSLAAFYERIMIGHIEAGLRTGNIHSPWPEEANRRMIASMAQFHFAPTEQAKNSLIQEHVPIDSIIVTGNTVIDSLLWMTNRIEHDDVLRNNLLEKIIVAGYPINSKRRYVLITGHRRENFGDKFFEICHAIKQLANDNTEVDFVYPVHLNSNVRKPVFEVLKDCKNIYLTEPLDYATFVVLMTRCYLILTDSGGIQEEAPALGKPVLIMRDTTERPEAILAGVAKLVGTSRAKIIVAVQELLDDTLIYNSYSGKKNPFGDGLASRRIIDYLEMKL